MIEVNTKTAKCKALKFVMRQMYRQIN